MTDSTELAKRALELAAKATPGPWILGEELSAAADAFVYADHSALVTVHTIFADDLVENDATFIAEARELLPVLATELLASSDENSRLRRALDDALSVASHDDCVRIWQKYGPLRPIDTGPESSFIPDLPTEDGLT